MMTVVQPCLCYGRVAFLSSAARAVYLPDTLSVFRQWIGGAGMHIVIVTTLNGSFYGFCLQIIVTIV